jgi:hypothetical protein
MILKPFFRYYGGKWRAVHRGLYPQPLHRTIVEPFAGSAGYALHYPHHDIVLVERDPCIAGIWRWLKSTTPDHCPCWPTDWPGVLMQLGALAVFALLIWTVAQCA